MQKQFGFYGNLYNDFILNLPNLIETNNLNGFLQNEIRSRLFNPDYCETIESIKKRFLAENIRLEESLRSQEKGLPVVNDLNGLKKISDSIYELLQTHWEFYKYEKSVVNNRVLVAFLLNINKINDSWETYLLKHGSMSSLLKMTEIEKKKEGFSPATIQYFLPAETVVTFDILTSLNQFLLSVYRYVAKLQNLDETKVFLELVAIEAGNPINLKMLMSDRLIKDFKRFLDYLSIDIVKREILVKYVMEVIRLQKGSDIPKQAVMNFQKNIAKQLNSLVAGGYISVSESSDKDSVSILSDLCSEMEQLKIKHSDLLTGTADLLARNELKPSKANLTGIDFKPNSKTDKTNPPSDQSNKGEKTPEAENMEKSASTVKLDVKNKEHIGFLTT